MAGAIAQSVRATGGAASATTLASGDLGSATTSGNYLLVAVQGEDATVTCADSLGNTFTQQGSIKEAAINRRLTWFTAPITTGGSSNSVTATYSTSVIGRVIVVMEISGVNSFDVGDTKTSTGANPIPNPALSATNTAQPAFAVAYIHNIQSTSIAVGSGYTLYSTFNDENGSARILVQYKAITSVAAQTAQFANAGFDRCNMFFGIFIDGSGGGGGGGGPIYGSGMLVDGALYSGRLTK